MTQNNPIQLSIKKKLIDSLNPSYIEVINESYMHNVPKGSETHFKVIVVSDLFKDKPLIKVKNNEIHDITFTIRDLMKIFYYILYLNFIIIFYNIHIILYILMKYFIKKIMIFYKSLQFISCFNKILIHIF